MALPESDPAPHPASGLVSAVARAPVGRLKVEADVSDRHVDIVEVRPPWDGVGEHTRFPIARLRYTKATGLWAIYWRDRNLKFHEYKRKRPTKNVQALLDHIETGGDPIFWG